tara:strand:- start:1290 stop:1460 length:171 start_codon:yes stop_codon:yes gene_type:complete
MSFKEWNREIESMKKGEKKLLFWNILFLIIIFCLITVVTGCDGSGIFISNIELDKI